MKKGIILFLTMAFAFSAIFAGGAKDSGKPKLVYWTMWNEAEPQGMVIGKAVEAFTEKTGIDVEVNFNGREIRKTLQPALDAGETIDLFDEDIYRVINTWGKYLLPLDNYITQVYPTTNGKPYKDVVNQALMTLVSDVAGGKVVNIPYQPSAFVILYNKDLFAKAGIKNTPKTKEEFIDVCTKLHAIGIPGITVDDAYMASFFGYNMDRLVGKKETLRMVKENDFSGPQVLEFAKIWEMMAKKGYISPKAASNIWPSGQTQEMAKGKVGMYLNGTWLPNEIKSQAPNLNWGAFAFPALSNKGDGIEANHFGGQSFGINKNSKYADEAFQLIVWLTTGEWDVKLAQESIGIPAGRDSTWPKQLAEAKAVVEATTIHLPWAVGMEDNPDINAKIKENFAKLIKGDFNAEEFANAMKK